MESKEKTFKIPAAPAGLHERARCCSLTYPHSTVDCGGGAPSCNCQGWPHAKTCGVFWFQAHDNLIKAAVGVGLGRRGNQTSFELALRALDVEVARQQDHLKVGGTVR